MILVEFTELPGRVFATHRDRQADEVAAAYPRDRYAIWNFAGSVRIGRDGPPEIPEGATLVEGFETPE